MSQTPTLGWGIVAPGAISRTFAESLRRHRAGRVVAVTGRSLERSREFAREFGGSAVDTLEQLLADPAVQAVYVATPHPQHFEPAHKVLEAGKALLCEKPMTVSVADTEALVAASRRLRVPLAEAYMYRCHPQVAWVQEVVRSGQLGKPVLLEAPFCFAAPFDPKGRLFAPELGRGGIYDVGGYPVSLALAIGSAASGSLVLPTLEAAWAERAPTGVDAHATATLRFPGGFVAKVSCAVMRDLGQVATLHLEHGRVVLETPYLVDNQRHAVAAKVRIARDGRPEEVRVLSAPVDNYAAEALALAAMVAAPQKPLEPPAPLVGHAESLALARLLDAWRRAALA